MKYEVTLKDLRQKGACYQGYNKVVRGLQGVPYTEEDRHSYIHYVHKENIPLLKILESNGLNEALWALKCVPESDRDVRLFAVWYARQFQHLLTDPRSINALDVAERFARGEATDSELTAARAAAWEAAEVAAGVAAEVAAEVAAGVAARAAMMASVVAAKAAMVTIGSPVGGVVGAAQEEMFKLMCQGQAPWQTQA